MDKYLLDHIEELNRDDFNNPMLYKLLFECKSTSERQMNINKLGKRASELKIKKAFEDTVQAYKSDLKNLKGLPDTENTTNFTILEPGTEVPKRIAKDMKHITGQLNCGRWICNDNGVSIWTEKGEIEVCSHPIFPIRVLKNLETGKYKVELVYDWHGIKSIFMPREILASATKIIELAGYGVLIKARSASYFSEYLTDMEKLNPNVIQVVSSTSRLGWVEDDKTNYFLPYYDEIVYDNMTDFKVLYESIQPTGSKEKWYECVKEIRARKQPEVLINLAASFSSVLIRPCRALSFIVSLWGGTGIGKSVILKLCASVWADPKEGKYIADAKDTPVAMEIKQDILNSLPMLLDDLAQINNQNNGDYSNLIYRWCAGNGRARGTKEATLRPSKHWENCVITNGERSMVTETTQGGAINRVIDIEASGENLFDGKTGSKTIEVINDNYGWAGEEFIGVIMQLGFDEIYRLYGEFYDKIKKAAEEEGTEKEDKQITPMALILLADYLIEKHLFCDGVTIDIKQAISYLINKGAISEVETAYELLIDSIAVNSTKFGSGQNMSNVYPECWGTWMNDNKYIAIIPSQLEKMIGSKSLVRSFVSWAKRKDILICDKGKHQKNVQVTLGNEAKKTMKLYVIDTTYKRDGEDNTTIDEELYEELPWR